MSGDNNSNDNSNDKKRNKNAHAYASSCTRGVGGALGARARAACCGSGAFPALVTAPQGR